MVEPAELSFEEAFGRLQATVDQLEQGGLSLAEALTVYELGMRLVGQCASQLERSELRLSQIDQALGQRLADLEGGAAAAERA
jgi:exodeoxyribonuclease VII small subunit